MFLLSFILYWLLYIPCYQIIHHVYYFTKAFSYIGKICHPGYMAARASCIYSMYELLSGVKLEGHF
jgi:hypothetical protein